MKDPLLSLGATDFSHARTLTDVHGDDARFCTDTGCWHLLDPQSLLWRVDTTNRIRYLTLDVARTYAHAGIVKRSSRPKASARLLKTATGLLSARRLQAIVDLASVQPEFAITSDRFDRDPFLLSVNNGVINLRSGTLRAREPADHCVKVAPVSFVTGAGAPRWLRFLDEVFAGDRELIDFVQRFVGYSLTGDTREHQVVLLHGSGANGKSTFVRVLRDLLGDYGANVHRSTLLRRRDQTGPREDIARLAGKRLVTCVEVEDDLDEALLKEMTGGDIVTARPLYSGSIEFRPQLKLLVTTNNLPPIARSSEAIWRRLRVIPFSVSFRGREEKDLDKVLASELPGILAWAIEGCLKWQREGLGEAAAVREATGTYRGQEDTVARFLEEECEAGEAFQAPRGELFKAYQDYCTKTGARHVTTRMFNEQMAQQGHRMGRSNRERYWTGVRMKPPSLEVGGVE